MMLRLAFPALVLLSALGGLGGCSRPAPAALGPARADAFGRVSGRPSARRWLDTDAKRARSAGAGDSQVVAVDAGASGDRVSGLLNVPAHDCVLLIARAADSVEDVDLFAYGDDGTVLGADEGSDKTPTLLVCPPHPRRLFVSARIAAGHGIVAIGAQRVPATDADRVGKLLGARGHPSEAASRLSVWPGLEEKLAEHRRLIGARWQDVRRLALPIDPRVPTRVSAVIEQDRCLDVLVVPSDEVSYLDLSVLDIDGRIVGRGSALGRDRALIVCSPTKSAVTIEIRPHAGRGIAAVLLSKSTALGSPELAQDSLVFDLGPIGELADIRAKNALRLEQAGYAQAKVVGQGPLEVGRRASVALDLPAGCARLDVLGGTPVRGLQSWLWAEDGSLVASDRGNGHATLFACGAGGKARLDTEALTRAGRYAVELRRENETPKLLEQQPLAASRLLASMISHGLIKSARQVGAPKLVLLTPTRLETMPLLVPIGRCVDVTLALGPGASGAEIRLVEIASNIEIAYARGTSTANARACALDRAGTLNARAELRVAAGQTAGLVATRMLSPRT